MGAYAFHAADEVHINPPEVYLKWMHRKPRYTIQELNMNTNEWMNHEEFCKPSGKLISKCI